MSGTPRLPFLLRSLSLWECMGNTVLFLLHSSSLSFQQRKQSSYLFSKWLLMVWKPLTMKRQVRKINKEELQWMWMRKLPFLLSSPFSNEKMESCELTSLHLTLCGMCFASSAAEGPDPALSILLMFAKLRNRKLFSEIQSQERVHQTLIQ